MTGKGLVISIDYTDEYCQACYYSRRHEQPESVSAGTDVMRYLIPSVLCYDPEEDLWAIGNSAVRLSEKAGVFVFRELLQNVLAGTTSFTNQGEYSSAQLFAFFFSKLLEFIQIRTSIMAVENITVTMKRVSRETKEAFERVFQLLNIAPEKVRLLSSAESFGYYIVNETPELWKNGALLFDFSQSGFFVKQLYIAGNPQNALIYVNEFDFSDIFSINDLASEMLQHQLDLKLTDLYQDLLEKTDYSSVYFTGEGFDEQWFSRTLATISGTRRAFKGNNIYVKGACMAGFLRSVDESGEFPIICSGRTRTRMTVEARELGQTAEILLSDAALAWYDAGFRGDFILETETSIRFYVTSLVSGNRSFFDLELNGFPKRPSKATRVEISVQFFDEFNCEVTVRDKGFGEFYRNGGAAVSKRISLEGYI